MRRAPLPRAAHAGPIPATAGIGLRFPHHQAVLAGEAGAAWFEVHPENYLGGAAADILQAVPLTNRYRCMPAATGIVGGSAQALTAIISLTSRLLPGASNPA